MSSIHPASQSDLREALYNGRLIGPASTTQLPREAVTTLHALLIDLDADILKENIWFPPADSPEAFYAGIRPVLERHPILRHAEIRDSGRWLHAIVWFDPPVELFSAGDQRRWGGAHQLLKASVPSDPQAPHLIAHTRPIGSVNGKTGRTVRLLKPGAPVSAKLIEEWAQDTRRSPFELLGMVLFGEKRSTPCPYCLGKGTRLDLGEFAGFCYGGCGQIPLKRLHAPFLKEGEPSQTEGVI